MKTPINVMIEVEVMQALDAMAKDRKKSRTAMITELIMGTSKGKIIDLIVKGWFETCDGVDEDDLKRLVEALTR